MKNHLSKVEEDGSIETNKLSEQLQLAQKECAEAQQKVSDLESQLQQECEALKKQAADEQAQLEQECKEKIQALKNKVKVTTILLCIFYHVKIPIICLFKI